MERKFPCQLPNRATENLLKASMITKENELKARNESNDQGARILRTPEKVKEWSSGAGSRNVCLIELGLSFP
jgi:hypothetical protein